MKRILYLLTFASSVLCAQAGAFNDGDLFPSGSFHVGQWQSPTAWQGFQPLNASPLGFVDRLQKDTAVADLATSTWGFLTSPTGSTWMYTEDFEKGSNRFYKSASITLYDETFAKVGQIAVNVPGGVKCNRIEPYGTVTQNLFDRNVSDSEVSVFTHCIGENYVGQDTIIVYHTNGDKLLKIHADYGVYVNQTSGSTKYQRFLVGTDDSVTVGDVKKSAARIDVYKQPAWGKTELTLEHTFLIPDELITYSNGSYVMPAYINGDTYYVTAHYEKPYSSGVDDTGAVKFTPDNSYIVKVYDKNYALADSISVPIESPSGYYRTAGIGQLSYNDLTKGEFTGDDKFNYIITFTDDNGSEDGQKYSFMVYDNQGVVDTIFTDAVTLMKMGDVLGQETQYAFIKTTGNGQEMDMVDVPSCKQVCTIPYSIGNFYVSAYIDRYPVGNSYQYAIGGRNKGTDASGNVIAQIAWVKPDATIDHTVNVNLGPNAVDFVPNISSYTLNPYLINTNEGHEYMYLTKISGESGTQRIIALADSLGNTFKSFAEDDTLGIVQSGSLMNSKTTHPGLIIAYQNTSNQYRLKAYSLPFLLFEKGGDGTKASPYLISTKGDMAMTGNYPTAFFKMTDDIDMSAGDGTWTPIDGFAGSLDGDGHAIDNLVIDNTASNIGL